MTSGKYLCIVKSLPHHCVIISQEVSRIISSIEYPASVSL